MTGCPANRTILVFEVHRVMINGSSGERRNRGNAGHWRQRPRKLAAMPSGDGSEPDEIYGEPFALGDLGSATRARMLGLWPSCACALHGSALCTFGRVGLWPGGVGNLTRTLSVPFST